MSHDPSSLRKLQQFLRDLFQLDLADLDFGIYRLLSIKREEVEAFLDRQLPETVARALEAADADERAKVGSHLAELTDRVREEIADEALTADGSIADEYREAKAKAARELIQEYENARERLATVEASDEQRAEVFNHLLAFFRRYYDEGDFIPKRRYGTRERYAIPYNGEETLLHWANRGQHYVKSAEIFRDYAFRVEGGLLDEPCRVRFVLTDACVSPGDTKGDTRYFYPDSDAVEWDEEERILTIAFEYRPPTEKEAEGLGRVRVQETILDEALDRLRDALPDGHLTAALLPAGSEGDDEDEAPPRLLRHLRRFVRRNTSDYFVHRDLKGFLERELEFYIKDQVVRVGDLEGNLEARRRMLRVLQSVAGDIIDFLSQIEEVQKRLFEKRKFVLRTDYLVLIRDVPRDMWSEVLSNEEQIDEWERLFRIDPKEDLFNPEGEVIEAFLEQRPTLQVNTALFDDDFRTRLLASFDHLEEATGGILVHSENYQALRLLEPRFRDEVKCIYIDPPYNTDASPILYKNGYKSSTWTTLMEGRLRLSETFLMQDGVLAAAIDDEQHDELNQLLKQLFNNYLGAICVRSNPSGRPTKSGYSVSHEYLLFAGKTEKAGIGRLPPTQKQLARFSQRDEGGRFEWRNLRREGSNSDRAARPALYYPIYIAGDSFRIPQMVWDDDSEEWKVQEDPTPDETVVWPINEGGRKKTWRWEVKTVLASRDDIGIRPDRTGKDYVYYKRRPHEKGVVSVSSWFDAKYSATEHGTGWLKKLFGEAAFSYPKSIHAVQDAIYVAGGADRDAVVLDYFAGSGTTAEAVLRMNREDEGHRNFVLVEAESYFDEVLLPRIQKVIYAGSWVDGRPEFDGNADAASHISPLIKILRLESYEDALHNLVTEQTLERERNRTDAIRKAEGEERHRLRYLARLPLEASPSLLAVDRLAHPFRYEIEVLTDHGPKLQTVDLVETFNFVYGLRVRRLASWVNAEDGDREYRVVTGTDPEGRSTLVLWRDMEALDPASERGFLECRIAAEEGAPFDTMLINGDCTVPGIRSLDPVFKTLIEEGEA